MSRLEIQQLGDAVVSLLPDAARALDQIVAIDGGTRKAAAGRAIELWRRRIILQESNKAYAAAKSSTENSQK